MLEPRWTEPLTGLRFIGGTADFDIWYQPASKYLVLVSGNRDVEWAAYHFYGGEIEGTGLNDENLSADVAKVESQEDVDAAIAYLKLFAPDLFRERPKQ